MLRLVDGELLRHLPGAPGLVLVDGELYGTLSPAVGQPGGGGWTFTESLALQDSIGDRLADKFLTTSLGLGNTHQHYAEVVRSDSPSLADAIDAPHFLQLIFGDSLAVLGAIAREASTTTADTLMVADSIHRQRERWIAENLPMLDADTRTRVKDALVTETLTLAETLVKVAEVTQVEALQLAHVCVMGWLEKQKKASEWTECAPQAGVWTEQHPMPR